MFASGEIPDVVQASSYTDAALANAVAEGVFMPLEDLIPEYAPHLWETIPQETWEALRYDDGHIYGLPICRLPQGEQLISARISWTSTAWIFRLPWMIL